MAVIDKSPNLPFTTDIAGHRTGRPLRAQACECPRPVLDDGTCVWCGHTPAESIDEVFDRRARELAGAPKHRRGYLSREKLR